MKSIQTVIPFIGIFLIFLLSSSCDTDVPMKNGGEQKVESNEKFAVINGVLHIHEEDDYIKLADSVRNMPEPEFLKWEKSLGFKSLRSWIIEANQKLDDITTKEQYEKWMNEYNDIIKIENNEIKPIIEHPIAQIFGNRMGDFMIGKIIAKAYENKLVYIQDGDREKLLIAKSLDKSDIEKGILIEKFQYSNFTTRNSCPNYSDLMRQHGKHRVNYIVGYLIGSNPSTSERYTSIWIFLKGQKKNFWGNWKDYDAELKWMECEWQVKDNWGRTHTQSEYILHSNGVKVYSIYDHRPLYDYTPVPSYNGPIYNYYKGKGTSNFLDWNKYAVHCCGFPSNECPAADG